MTRNRMLLLAASAAALILPLGGSLDATAATSVLKLVNGKPCTPFPASKIGIQLYSFGLLTGTATNVDDANSARTGGGRGGAAGGAPGAAGAAPGAPGAAGGGRAGGAAGAAGAAGAPGAAGGGRGGGGAAGAAGGAPGAAAGGRGGGAAGAGGAAGGGRGAAGGAAPGAAPAAARAPTPQTLPDGSTANIPLVDSAFARLKQFGFAQVERAGYYALSPAQLKTELAKAKLGVVGGHDSITAINLDSTMDYALKSGQTTYVGAAGWQYGGDNTPEAVKTAADGLNAAGQKALAKGLHLYVHNHTAEFTPVMYDIRHDGHPIMVPAIEALMDQTDPKYLSFEIDVHWIIEAYMGAPYNEAPLLAQQTALDFVRRHADRIVLFHIKETNPAVAGGQGYLGQGITDWPAWMAAGKNVKFYIYEMDGPPNILNYAEVAGAYMNCRATPTVS